MGRELQIEVRGSGIAASCCRLLLARSGVTVSFASHDRPRVPAILISRGTQNLLEDVCERASLFEGLGEIRRRVVAWGSQPPITLPHSGFIVSEQELLNRLGHPESHAGKLDSPDWTIHSGGPLPEQSTAPKFGSRTTTASRVQFAANADPEACLMESAREGWLFLLPTGDRTGLLLTSGSSVTELLDESRLVRSSIDCLTGEAGSFPAHPRIADPLCGRDWLACGSAAIGFDPLCGDGSGHAIREAVLACAVVGHSSPITEAEELLWEYRLRLWRGFRRHLELCLQYYSTGGQGEWWQDQCASLRQGLNWLAGRNAPRGLGLLHLNGFALERASH